MRLRIASDLHFEFHEDHGRTLADEVTRGEYDVLVVAGDLSSYGILSEALAFLLHGVNDRPLVYVLGNHEFYGSSRARVIASAERAQESFPNFHFLDGRIAEIDGVRFLGTPLWFKKSAAPKWAMNDFSAIERFESWVYDENYRAIGFLENELEAGDVVVTHYLPTEESVHLEFKGSPLNPFFLCDVKPLIERRKPALWIHGHTHRSCDYQVGETRIVCNPFGYVNHEENPGFMSDLTIEAQEKFAKSGRPR